jgi:hypothetical protein
MNEISPEGRTAEQVNRCICCPHCETAFSEAQIRSILGRFARAQRLSQGGASRFAKMTPEQRSAEARKAVNTRWAKVRAREVMNPEITVPGPP